jgi:hypothetical protein
MLFFHQLPVGVKLGQVFPRLFLAKRWCVASAGLTFSCGEVGHRHESYFRANHPCKLTSDLDEQRLI